MAPHYPRIVLSPHARERREEGRQYISESLARRVVEDPTNELPEPKKGRRKFWKEIDGQIYVVVVKEEKNGKRARVITAFARDPFF